MQKRVRNGPASRPKTRIQEAEMSLSKADELKLERRDTLAPNSALDSVPEVQEMRQLIKEANTEGNTEGQRPVCTRAHTNLSRQCQC